MAQMLRIRLAENDVKVQQVLPPPVVFVPAADVNYLASRITSLTYSQSDSALAGGGGGKIYMSTRDESIQMPMVLTPSGYDLEKLKP